MQKLTTAVEPQKGLYYTCIFCLKLSNRFHYAFQRAIELLNFHQGKYLFQVACITPKTIKFCLEKNEIMSQLSSQQVEQLTQLNNVNDEQDSELKFNI